MPFPNDKEMKKHHNKILRLEREVKRRTKIRDLAMEYLMNGEFSHMAREVAFKRAINRATLVYDDVMAYPIAFKESIDG